MTFEDWLHHRFPAGVDGYAHMLNLGDLEQAWNAAISAAISKLESGHYYWDEDNYGRSTGFYKPHPKWGDFEALPEEELRKLLTAF